MQDCTTALYVVVGKWRLDSAWYYLTALISLLPQSLLASGMDHGVRRRRSTDLIVLAVRQLTVVQCRLLVRIALFCEEGYCYCRTVQLLMNSVPKSRKVSIGIPSCIAS